MKEIQIIEERKKRQFRQLHRHNSQEVNIEELQQKKAKYNLGRLSKLVKD
jgi:hypothetical protein